MRRIVGSALAGTLLCLAPRAGATTFIPPASLADLAAESDVVCMAVAGAAAPRQRGAFIFTETEFVAGETLAGNVRRGDRFAVRTPGGEIGGRGWHVAGSPRFLEGGAYFLCLRRAPDGAWLPAMLSYGLLEEMAGPDRRPVLAPCAEAAGAEPLPRLDGVLPEKIGVYRRDAFLRHLGAVLAGREAWQPGDVQIGEASTADSKSSADKETPEACEYFTIAGRKLRWNTFDGGGIATIHASAGGDDSVAGGGFAELVKGLDLWHGIPGTSLNLEFGGGRISQIKCTTDQDVEAGLVVFNDPCDDIADLSDCTGILAYGGPFTTGTHRFDGEYWVTIVTWAVVVNNGSGCIGSTNYARLLAHELGHGLGYGHFDDRNALMYMYCCNAPNATDALCAQYTYPPRTAGNQRPEVDAGPSGKLVLAGDTARLAGVAADDGLPAPPGALAYQWSVLSGPAAVTFSDAGVPAPSVRFSVSGTYLFALRVSDGELLRTDTVALDVQINALGARTLSFRERVGGYAGTRDTFIRQSAPAAGAGASTELRVDGDDPSGSGLAIQTLIAFDGVFGADPAQVPPGASIVSARLDLTGTDAGNPLALHRMLVPWAEEAVWNDFGADGIVAGSECLAAADASAAGVTGTVAFDATAALAEWARDPCAAYGWAVLPTGADGWRASSSESAAPPRLAVTYAIPAVQTLIAPGETWRFLRGFLPLPADWNEADFDDAAWEEGPTGIGYGGGDDATVLADMQSGYLAVFCRKAFQVVDPAAIEGLDFAAVYDDGLVAYLNGVEVARVNMPAGEADADTAAASPVDMQTAFLRLPPALLRAGTNVLAVSVHNATLTSSDLSFSPLLNSVAAARAVVCGPLPEFLRGDANDDAVLDIADAVRILGYLFQEGAAPACPDALDANDDGRIDISDAVSMLRYLFASGPLAAPGEVCGPDPTPDALGECAAPVCAP
ncbi:MAG TPA: hypothetical protein DCM87_08460 [Planctomycetes bacterium]|nr:hypothetical protein [Planctomycetota bacterium]